MIDALFGSRTRVKLLHLFLNNPGKSFYVREITRLIDEQINSVRRELSNMLEVGIITSDTADNKLYYQVSQQYEYFVPLKAIFGDEPMEAATVATDSKQYAWHTLVEDLPGVRVAIAAGALVRGSASSIDLLVVGDVPQVAFRRVVQAIEKKQGRELNYSLLDYNEFYYRMSVRDKFITEIVTGKHAVIVDTDNVLKRQK